jgi:ketosteroid isomerase-like protein
MSSDNVTIIKQIYEAFARGDVPAVFGAFAPSIEWREAEGFIYADGNPYVGPESILQGVFMRLASEWDGFAVQPQQIVATDQGALTQGRYTGTCKATGRRVDAQFAHVWTIADGKVSRFQQYTDTAQFHQAAAR